MVGKNLSEAIQLSRSLRTNDTTGERRVPRFAPGRLSALLFPRICKTWAQILHCDMRRRPRYRRSPSSSGELGQSFTEERSGQACTSLERMSLLQRKVVLPPDDSPCSSLKCIGFQLTVKILIPGGWNVALS